MKLHRQVAEVYLADPRPDPELIAWHLQQAEDARTAEWLIRAGEQAEHRFAWKIALERHEEAVNILRLRGDNEVLLARVLLRMGRLFRFTDQRRTVALLEESRRVALDCGDEVTAAFALFNIGAYERNPGPKQPRLEKMRQAIETLSSTDQDIKSIGRWAVTRLAVELDPVATIRGTFALQLAWAGRPQEAVARATEHLPENWEDDTVEVPGFSEHYPDPSNPDAYAGLTVAYSHLGVPDKSGIANELQLHLARKLNFRPGVVLQQNGVPTLLHFPYRTKDLTEREELLAFLEGGSSGAGESLSLRNETYGLDYCYLMNGSWDKLRRRINAGIVPTITVLWHVTMYTYARFAIYEGSLDWAHEIIPTLLPDGPEESLENHIHPLPGESQRLGALLALEQSQPALARRWLDAHDEWMDWIGAVLGRAEGLMLWARLHLAEGHDEAAWQRANEALAQASNPEQPLMLIAIHRLLGQLSIRAGDLEAATEYLEQSVDLAKQCAIPYERALSTYALAEIELLRGKVDRCRRLLAEVRRCADHLNARPLMRCVEQLAHRLGPRQEDGQFGLSSREHEVLLLLVRGMSDRDIAEELFISHRTVSHHVSSILRKLDVESRTAAATHATNHGIT